jgi:type IV secretion system protein VirB10
LLPKKTQQLVILGVAVVMVSIMWITSGGKRSGKTSANPPTSALVQAADPAAVQDFKQTIQKEQAARRQPISSSDLARLQRLEFAGDVPPGSIPVPPDGTIPQPGGVLGASTSQLPPDPIREDKKKRQYLSLFANNMAFSSRKGDETVHLGGGTSKAANLDAPGEVPPGPTTGSADLEARLPQAAAEVSEPNRAEVRQVAANQPEATNAYAAKRHVLFEGTILETLLINRLNGTFSGPVNCLVTNDIYSHDRQHVLIPAGTKVLGEAKKVDALGQQRLAVFFHRLVMPDGFSVPLDQFKGLNQIGETSLRDKVNSHYLQIFGASLAVGILGGIAQAGTGNVLTNSALDRIQASFGSNVANSSLQILDRFLNVLPTVTIREGNRVKVYLSGDLLLPDYAQHSMRPDL